MASTTKTQPQLLLHGRIPHNVLVTLASSTSNSVEKVGGNYNATRVIVPNMYLIIYIVIST